MSFRIIKAEERLASFMTWYAGIQTKVTDFIAGSKTRSRFETIAIEMEAQDYQIYVALKKAIPTAIYQAFGFELKPAVKASGLVTFSASAPATNDVPIPKGTQVAVSDSSKIYETIADATLLTGQTNINVSAICTVPGTAGNTGPNTVTVMKSTISGIASVNNTAGFTNGKEKETEEERRSRFTQYISTLAKGVNAAIEYSAEQAYLTGVDGNITEQVVSAKVIEPFRTDPNAPLGRINCFISNGVGGASVNLIDQAQKLIDGYVDDSGNRVVGSKAAGVICTVLPFIAKAVNVTVQVTAFSGYDKDTIATNIRTAIDSYVRSLNSESFVYNELIARLKRLDGVNNINILSPTGNVVAADNEVFVPGVYSVTVE